MQHRKQKINNNQQLALTNTGGGGGNDAAIVGGGEGGDLSAVAGGGGGFGQATGDAYLLLKEEVEDLKKAKEELETRSKTLELQHKENAERTKAEAETKKQAEIEEAERKRQAEIEEAERKIQAETKRLAEIERRRHLGPILKATKEAKSDLKVVLDLFRRLKDEGNILNCDYEQLCSTFLKCHHRPNYGESQTNLCIDLSSNFKLFEKVLCRVACPFLLENAKLTSTKAKNARDSLQIVQDKLDAGADVSQQEIETAMLTVSELGTSPSLVGSSTIQQRLGHALTIQMGEQGKQPIYLSVSFLSSTFSFEAPNFFFVFFSSAFIFAR